MVRDYSEFLPNDASSAPRPLTRLDHLGWQPFFAQQTDMDALEATPPVRVTEVHRSGLRVLGETADTLLPPRADATVGDWLLLNADEPAQSQLLDRKSLIKRRAPGHDRQVQLIAANIDTVFIVSSCNQDFNVARLERYIALAFDGGLDPVILLTKSDLVEDTSEFVEPAQAISDLVPVLALDAKSGTPAQELADWCKPGRTLAFLGTSGVGKSTLTNALLGTTEIATQGLRDDDRGRHTTTSRHLHLAPGGCTVLDTPGMRELQLTDATAGVDEVFADLFELSQSCRFNDCAHGPEPGCAITAAVADGTVDPARLARWQKLAAEERFNTATLAERRANDKAFGKKVRAAMAKKKR